jgi:hypothetical protein
MSIPPERQNEMNAHNDLANETVTNLNTLQEKLRDEFEAYANDQTSRKRGSIDKVVFFIKRQLSLLIDYIRPVASSNEDLMATLPTKSFIEYGGCGKWGIDPWPFAGSIWLSRYIKLRIDALNKNVFTPSRAIITVYETLLEVINKYTSDSRFFDSDKTKINEFVKNLTECHTTLLTKPHKIDGADYDYINTRLRGLISYLQAQVTNNSVLLYGEANRVSVFGGVISLLDRIKTIIDKLNKKASTQDKKNFYKKLYDLIFNYALELGGKADGAGKIIYPKYTPGGKSRKSKKRNNKKSKSRKSRSTKRR